MPIPYILELVKFIPPPSFRYGHSLWPTCHKYVALAIERSFQPPHICGAGSERVNHWSNIDFGENYPKGIAPQRYKEAVRISTRNNES